MNPATIQALMAWTDLVMQEVVKRDIPGPRLKKIVDVHTKLQSELIKEKTICQQKSLVF
ncbi:MAG: hypothetical protein KGL39_25950 [Patescibacteria group bacterium]|nr:hypothetical protein [Patescibacteria group bacterium]